VVDITEGTVFGLGIAQTIVLDSYGIPSGVTFGTAETVATVYPSSALSVSAVGTAKTNAAVGPVGIDADATVVGSPQLNASVTFSGLSSGVQFGDVETLATVFIIPGPVDPSNDFGDAVVTKKGWIFRPPVNTYQWRLFKEYEGISLLEENGTWSEVAHPDLERTRNATRYLGGGRDHVVSTSLKTELEGLGYTVTEEIVTTEEYLS
jgi:hypothetical protein